jgi:ankyrin repeat protein
MADIGALFDLVKTGDLAGVRELLHASPMLARQRLETGETPLMAALYRGHQAVVAALIDAGAEVDIFAAAATGRLDDLKRSINRDTVNAYAYDGWTPLHLAAFFGRLNATRMLIDAGADIHAVSSNGLKNTPLHAATAGKHSDVALALLASGANPHAVDAGGYTPLQIAEQNELGMVVAAIEPNSR